MVPLLLLSLAIASPQTTTTFTFVGQPECVELSYADGRTLLNNTCPDPVVVDLSVQLAQDGKRKPVVPPETSTHIRDLSAFTLGMNGELFRVVAVLSER